MGSKEIGKLFVLLIVLAVGLGCSGGGGGGGDDDDNGGGGDPTVSPVCVAFVGDAADTVFADMDGASSCEDLVVNVAMTSVTDVFGVGFTVNFDDSVVTYQGFDSSSSHLASDGASLIPDGDSPSDASGGSVLIGLTRIGSTGVDFTGASETVLKLRFRRVGSTEAGDEGLMSFSGTNVFDSNTPPTPKGGIGFSGGMFDID